MTIPILATKLYIPPRRANAVTRPRLIERLNGGLHRKLTVIAAGAGFGKTTLVGEWLAGCERPVAWLSLDEGENDPARFLTYLFAALKTIGKQGEEIARRLPESSPLPPIESIVTALLNEIAAVPSPFVLVLDDYHVIKTEPVDRVVALLLERMPPHMHLVIATREDPRLPLARLRVRDQLTSVRAADLRFTCPEAADFLGRVMGLTLSLEDVSLLESRTEGWIAGLQLAALSIKEQQDASSFIQSFTGNHSFVLDYLVEEVLNRQSASMQAFLLHTSILDRLCGPLCEAVLGGRVGESGGPPASGQVILDELERANLFLVPLDHERRWYRYHQLFADLLRQRLRQSIAMTAGDEERAVAELHRRASEWYEDNGLELEAFRHAVAARDIQRAARLAEGEGMPLHFRGASAPVREWLDGLSKEELDARPGLRVIQASVMLMAGQSAGVEPLLQAAEASLPGGVPDVKIRDVIGHMASIRATLAVSRHEADTILAESRRALEYLHPDNLPVRTAAVWSLGYAYELQGDRTGAGRAYAEALTVSRRIGHVMITLMASLGMGHIQELENELEAAAESYRSVLKIAGDPPLPAACEAHLGLARIWYEWNDLDSARHHGELAAQLAQRIELADRVVAAEAFLARLKLAQGDSSGAAAIIRKADRYARQHHFVKAMPLIAEAHVLVLLRQGELAAAAHLAQKNGLRLSRTRVYMAQGDAAAALALLEPMRAQAEAEEREDERLKVTVVLAAALHAHGDKLKAAHMLRDALTMGEPGGFIRTFTDEGIPMKVLLTGAAADGTMPEYAARLLAACEAEEEREADSGTLRRSASRPAVLLIEPLSERETEVLRLIAQGLSNRDICDRLYLAMSTVKGHNRNLFDKLHVKRRTEAVARARELGLL
ncbi:LuxR C-terminal-related transcriptional regulator [Paenibacillus hodogayensis]|uniref:LuxR C-terminal-related transcriptional regulator n=1 Tax=Paenibacillus hodogayensis TaxID=279208 RepID=A0ABV5VWG1_9BACL